MKITKLISAIILLAIMLGCGGSNKQSQEELPYIDVSKEYPEKGIDLTDIADVTYMHLSSESDDYLYKGSIDYATKNRIVVIDRSSHSLLFFSKDGNPKSRFNRRGQGPEEYSDAFSVMYDEESDDVFVSPDFSDYIMIYSSSGEYKRKINLPQMNINGQMALFDDQSILVYDNTKLWQTIMQSNSGGKINLTEQVVDSSFFLISKTDGAVLEYIQLPNKNIDLSYKNLGGDFIGQISYGRVRKGHEGLFLYNPEADTVFLYSKDKTLTPYMHKKPLLSDYNPMTVMDICMDVGRFQFMSVYPYLKAGGSPSPKYYMRDKETGEIFRQKIILPDYQEKDFYINPRLSNYYEKEHHFELDLTELEEAYKENKLSGKLKELVASLLKEEDANNVFVFVDFITD